jgi:hypothetical protein
MLVIDAASTNDNAQPRNPQCTSHQLRFFETALTKRIMTAGAMRPMTGKAHDGTVDDSANLQSERNPSGSSFKERGSDRRVL